MKTKSKDNYHYSKSSAKRWNHTFKWKSIWYNSKYCKENSCDKPIKNKCIKSAKKRVFFWIFVLKFGKYCGERVKFHPTWFELLLGHTCFGFHFGQNDRMKVGYKIDRHIWKFFNALFSSSTILNLFSYYKFKIDKGNQMTRNKHHFILHWRINL